MTAQSLGAATLTYDAAGRLSKTIISGTETQLLYDGTNLIAEYNSAGTLLKRYVHSNGVDEPIVVYDGATTTNKNWLYADHLGSIVALANTTGTATATYTYSAEGKQGGSTPTRFGYTGQQNLSGLGVQYYKARMYSADLGRFIQTDPIGMADDMNLYAYVGNNSVNARDPSGLAGVVTSTMALGSRAGSIAMAGSQASGLPFVLPLLLTGDSQTGDSQRSSTDYLTYTRVNPITSEVYSGRTSGDSSLPTATILSQRAAGQPLLNASGFSPPILDQRSSNRDAIRGREQQLIDFNGGAQSVGGTSRNMINGVSDYNPNRGYYMRQSNQLFGTLPDNSPDRYRVNF